MKSESNHQITFIQWCKRNTIQYPELDLIFWIRNESRSKKVRIMGKLMGIKPGIPDLLLPVARRTFHGLFIEMKKSKKEKLNPDQIKMKNKLSAQGYAVTRADNSEEAIDIIKSYLQI